MPDISLPLSGANRRTLFLGTFAAVTSILDWYLNASVKNAPFTEQERFLYELFLEKPHRSLPPPGMSFHGIGYLLVISAGVFFIGFMICRSLEQAAADFRQSSALYPKLARVVALVAGAFTTALFCYGDFILPAVMRFYSGASLGISVYVWLEAILYLPYHLVKRKG